MDDMLKWELNRPRRARKGYEWFIRTRTAYKYAYAFRFRPLTMSLGPLTNIAVSYITT